MIEHITVTELSELINTVLLTAYDFPKVKVEGEISNFKVSQNKWVYFDLKDGTSAINCFMTVWQLKIPLEDGMKVIVSGRPKLIKSGRFSYTIESIELFGEGALKRAYEILKTQLEAEGLFALERKRSLPKFPKKIGLITAPDSAAYHDFLNTLSKRFGGLKIYFRPAKVQGDGAPEEIVSAIKWFSKVMPELDVLVLIRGGGSLEDLQAFNAESVARAVFSSKIPIVSGVGHDVDVSLADLASDLRAKTPTDAAVLIVPERKYIVSEVDYLVGRISDLFDRNIREHNLFLSQSVVLLSRFYEYFEKRYYELLSKLHKDFMYFHRRARELRHKLNDEGKNFISRFHNYLFLLENKIKYEERSLINLDPKKILSRGYSIVSKRGKVLKSSIGAEKKDKIKITLHNGQLDAEIL